MGKFFGTDGIRAVANDGLDCSLALKVGQAAAEVLTEENHHRALIVIGKDTRISSDMLEAALVAGICSSGADVLLVGVVPTPAVAYITRLRKADAGIVISASHNSFEHNGIKIFNSEGYKLSDALEERIESLILSGNLTLRSGADIGRVHRDEAAVDTYIDSLASTVTEDLSSLRLLVDCANGSASATAERLFKKAGANADVIYNCPDGVNINDRCGSTHLGALAEKVLAGGYDAGVAFDGDADRCLIIDETGNIVDGDKIMAVCGMSLKEKGILKDDTIVATVMSNLGFHMFCKGSGLRVICAQVGDRYVLEQMQKGGYSLGGEQSGHLIFLDHSTTGDGQLSALKFLGIAASKGMKLSEFSSYFKQYPQILSNIVVKNSLKAHLSDAPEIIVATELAQKKLGPDGRILIRPSGTEPLVRVMVEGVDAVTVELVAKELSGIVETLSEKAK